MQSKKILSITLITVTVILAIVSFILLPDTVIIQFSLGNSNVTTAPKLLAVLLPIALGIGGAVAALVYKDNVKASGKSLLVSVIGIIVFAFMLIVNLMGT